MKHIDYKSTPWNEIVSKALQNDQDARKSLVEMTYEEVHFNCKKIVKNEEDTVLDLVQDTYLKVFKNLSSLKDPQSFPKWANTIACNTCFEYLRTQKKDRVDYFAPGESEDESDPYETYADQDHQVSPEKKLDTKETRNMMKEIIDDLPDAQRTAVIMYYYDDLSVSEIAEATQVTENTVKSRLNYARQKIKNSVEEYQKKYGIKLYSATPASFLLYIRHFLQMDASDAFLAAKLALPTALLVKNVVGTTVAGAVKGAFATEIVGRAGLGLIVKGALSTVAAKAAIAVSAIIVTVGTIIGVSYAQQNKPVETPTTETSSSVTTLDSTPSKNETSLPNESSSLSANSTLTKEDSKEDSKNSSVTDKSSYAEEETFPVVEASSIQEESSETIASVPEVPEDSSTPEESSVIVEESSTEVVKETSPIEQSSAPAIEESSSSPIEDSVEEESSVVCQHENLGRTYCLRTCSEDGYVNIFCYDCGEILSTDTYGTKRGGVCDVPTTPWYSVGEQISIGYAAVTTEVGVPFSYRALRLCSKCTEGNYTYLPLTVSSTPGYYVRDNYFDSIAEAQQFIVDDQNSFREQYGDSAYYDLPYISVHCNILSVGEVYSERYIMTEPYYPH